MKIKTSINFPVKSTFRDIEVGSYFSFNGKLYVKITDLPYDEDDSGIALIYNAFSFLDAENVYFGYNADVINYGKFVSWVSID